LKFIDINVFILNSCYSQYNKRVTLLTLDYCIISFYVRLLIDMDIFSSFSIIVRTLLLYH